MSVNILSEIKSSIEFLTKIEVKIAQIILDNPNRFTHLSITDLSVETGVSQGSINNFSKKFCGGGFSDLKLKIALCISAFNEKPFSVSDKASSKKAFLTDRINETVTAFNITSAINDENSLKEACDLILNADRIEIYGVYQSGIVARDLCYQLIQLGIPASYVTDTLMGAVAASMLNEKSLVIALSNTGQTKEILDAVEIAKSSKAKTLCITSNKHSPLAKSCDCVLLSAASGSDISNRYNEVRMSQMLITDTLCSFVRSVIDESGKKLYFKLEKILSSHSVKND